MWWDADIDAVMTRTAQAPDPGGPDHARTRPSASACSSRSARCWCSGLAANWLAAGLLAFTIVFYAVIYSMWLKRATAQNIVIGGAAGALPPVIGQAVVTGSVGIESLVLFAIIFIWTPPHFWALALIKADEYARAGIPMMPNVAGPASTRRQIVWLHAAPRAARPRAGRARLRRPALRGDRPSIGGLGMLAFSVQVFRNREGEAEKRAAMGMFGFSILYLFAAVLGAARRAELRPVPRRSWADRHDAHGSRSPVSPAHPRGGGAPPQALGRDRPGARRHGAAVLRADDRQARTADPEPAAVRGR